ncbi:hypothetical protein JOF42_000789 [Microbacterium phyllosphaerae]|uniref:DUF262 domain-containing protein n=1 Tax=Microbacterium phyllosphaerae TaxID=124798 RepID=A0ABS4WM62_9MICO|nr:DUF262 domain-containing protein [Microbacterium phyllosphaerae]MBP2377294.1 hypothetical protein [Microbacterium phyllosphaerae]
MSTGELNARLLTVGELFTDDTVYTVPVYQRNYAWRAPQIEQLISDIQDAASEVDSDPDAGYFLGNLIVTARPSISPDFEVIDGQQRLTTLHLLLSFLTESRALTSDTHTDRLRYESRPRAAEALRRVARNAATISTHDFAAREDTGIHEGFNVIQQFIKQHPTLRSPDALTAFADYLCRKVTLVRAELPKETDLNRYFEVMNTRGQQLQQVDIVKARLMSRLPEPSEQSCFAWIWDACADMDSYVQMSLTRGKPDLRTVIFGDDWSWLSKRTFAELCDARASSMGTSAEAPPPSPSQMSLDEALHAYSMRGQQDHGEDVDNVRFRSTIDFPAFLLHALKVMEGGEDELEGQLDDKRLIGRFEEAVPGAAAEQWVRKFAVTLLICRNIFDNLVLKRQFTATANDDGDWSVQRLIRRSSKGRHLAGYINSFSKGASDAEASGDVDETTSGIVLLESMLRVTYTSPRTMHWITRVLRSAAAAGSPLAGSDLAGLLQDYARARVREAFPVSAQPQGFDIPRIVFTYLDYLLLRDAPQRDFRFSFRNSIEHFYPQRPDEHQSGAVVSPENLNLIGNLALVSVGANSKFSNSLPRAKAENFRSTIEAQSAKLHLMAETTREQGWSDEQLVRHHREMVERIRRDLAIDDSIDPR